MIQWIRNFFARRQLQIFMVENRINPCGYGGLVIHGEVVSDYCYLLRFLTDEHLDSFNDLEAVCGFQGQIESAAKKELARPKLTEQEVFKIHRKLAVRNVEQLVKITQTIKNYVMKCRELNLQVGTGMK